MLKIDNLIKKYQNNIILNNISYDFSGNKIYLIRGDNGSGKSTLIKILTKISFKSSGNVVNDSKISYLPDNFMLPKLTKTKNFLLNFTDNSKLLDEYIKIHTNKKQKSVRIVKESV